MGDDVCPVHRVPFCHHVHPGAFSLERRRRGLPTGMLAIWGLAILVAGLVGAWQGRVRSRAQDAVAPVFSGSDEWVWAALEFDGEGVPGQAFAVGRPRRESEWPSACEQCRRAISAENGPVVMVEASGRRCFRGCLACWTLAMGVRRREGARDLFGATPR